jgi:hypothetical protein
MNHTRRYFFHTFSYKIWRKNTVVGDLHKEMIWNLHGKYLSHCTVYWSLFSFFVQWLHDYVFKSQTWHARTYVFHICMIYAGVSILANFLRYSILANYISWKLAYHKAVLYMLTYIWALRGPIFTWRSLSLLISQIEFSPTNSVAFSQSSSAILFLHVRCESTK